MSRAAQFRKRIDRALTNVYEITTWYSDSNLTEAPFNSDEIDIMELAMALEVEFGVSFENDEVQRFVTDDGTIGGLYAFMLSFDTEA